MAERKLWWARLATQSPRYEVWRGILGSDDVPLKAPGSGAALLGEERAEVYELDIAKLTPEQIGRLADFVATKFGGRREQILAELAKAELAKEGFPIRFEDVYLAFDMRAFL